MSKTTMTKGTDVKDIKPFFLTPSVKTGNSVIRQLMNDYGVENSGFITFKTGLIKPEFSTP